MGTTVKDFKNYINANKDKIDFTKVERWTWKVKDSNIFKEWQKDQTLWKQYLKPQPTPVVNKVEEKKSDSYMNTLNNKYNLWQTSDQNIMVDKTQASLQAIKDNNLNAAKEKKDLLVKWASEQSDILKKKNEEQRLRTQNQQALNDSNKNEASANVNNSKNDNDLLLKKQEEIATRQANIAAAEAGSSWLQMSVADTRDIKDDVIAKYWTNIANAMEFRNTTNNTLNSSLKDINNTHLSNQKDIDTFLNSLSDEEAKPLINALAEADKWNLQAIEDANTFVNELVKQKATKEFGNLSQTEAIEDDQREWSSLKTNRQKADKLIYDLWAWADTKWLADAYLANPEKFNNMSFQEARATLMKIKNQLDNIKDPSIAASLQSYLNTNAQLIAAGKAPQKVDAYEKILSWANESLWYTNRTQEKKRDEMWITWNQTTDLNLSKYWIKTSTATQLDDKLKTLWKDKTVWKLVSLYKDNKITKSQYNRMINYINNK